MGKKKVKTTTTIGSSASQEESTGGRAGEVKGKKTYNLDKKETGDADNILKVQLPDKLEAALVELILENKKSSKVLGDISKRITTKKLTDVYNSLSEAGFSKNQVEAAMSNTIMCGGDLLDALDWLCLNTLNDQLPAGFSETLQKEEEKHRPKFDASLQTGATRSQPVMETTSRKELRTEEAKAPKQKQLSAKDWILQYADKSSEEDDSEDEDANQEDEIQFDPTSQYTELFSKMQVLKDQAAIAKSNNAGDQHKQLSKQLKEIHLEMASLEKHPEFDKSVKSSLKNTQVSSQSQQKTKQKEVPGPKKDEEDGLGLNLFQALEKDPGGEPAPPVVQKASEEVRSFEYTRSQWTGKSPKQFLIDWVRKHLPRSGPPKFRKIQVKVTQFKCTAVVERPKEGDLEVTPTILCENVKDAEHLAATLALYHLCRGQPVHQLLPPPYRNVWLDWADSEKQEQQEAQGVKNKPREQFVAKLLKQLNLDNSATAGKREAGEISGDKITQDQEADEGWESLADKDELAEVPTSRGQKSSRSAQKSPDCELLRQILHRNQSNPEYQQLLKSRQQLPVFQYKEQVLSTVREHQVVVIAGETGSGKSTQVPQFILEDCIQRGQDGVNIVCTEPRRISAISLATRVSQEMGEKGREPNEALVGYQIRFESHRGPNTRLLYCTTGVLLRQLQSSPQLTGISHLIIDEVHERTMQSDFLMIVMKKILQQRPNLKVILMSATLDSEKMSAYFLHCPVINFPGRTFPVKDFYLEDVIEMTNFVVDDDSPYTLKQSHLVQEESAAVEITTKGGNTSKQIVTWATEDASKMDRTDLASDRYSLQTRNAITRLNLNRVNLELISILLQHIESSPPFSDIEGAVLIFLPGLSDIQEMYDILTTQRQFSNPARYQIFALHSVLSSQDQNQVFKEPPPGVRKVVIATNIAETGITIPDVVYVIDCGKAKENRYMEASRMSALEEVFISKASCKQRAGRAGRVREGFCFRLFTHEQFRDFRPFTTPEILRIPLEELCLCIMKCQYGKPSEFLSGALDPPQTLAVSRAMNLLKEVGACQSDESSLTPLGHHLAALPVDVRIGKMLIMGAIFGCLEETAVIAAAMTEKSPFVVPLSKRSEADAAKEAMAVACSDHITLYRAYHGWCRARQESRSAENSYISKNFLKRATLLDIQNVKNDLVRLVKTIGFEDRPEDRAAHTTIGKSLPPPGQVLMISAVESKTENLDASTVAVIKAVLTAGLYPQVGQVLTQPSVDVSQKSACLVETAQGVAQVHPSSVNKNLAATSSWLVYHEKVRLSRVYLRDTTLVSPYDLLLFGGDVDVQHTQRLVSLDGWIRFKAVAKAGVIFKELRILLNEMLERKLREPSLSISGSQLIKLLKELIRSEKVR